VGVAENSPKKTLFSAKERVNLIEEVIKTTPELNKDKVQVQSFKGLLVEFAKEMKANVILRGLRAVSDFEYELALASINRKLAPEIETVFMIPKEAYFYISSSVTKEIIQLGGCVSGFVPKIVEEKLKLKLKS
jgi:pantetheine-phosphate adenylyltransferase